jgi:hypothetical protein
MEHARMSRKASQIFRDKRTNIREVYLMTRLVARKRGEDLLTTARWLSATLGDTPDEIESVVTAIVVAETCLPGYWEEFLAEQHKIRP